ncbi:MAG: hypothetical protein ACFBSC_01835 [Microcoleaceae cyanobacterium]
MLLENDSSGSSSQPPSSSSSQPTPNSPSVRITLTGTRQSVSRLIQLLHQHNIILGSEWSSAIPIKNSSEVIRVAIRII